jgi:hypothetical protein
LKIKQLEDENRKLSGQVKAVVKMGTVEYGKFRSAFLIQSFFKKVVDTKSERKDLEVRKETRREEIKTHMKILIEQNNFEAVERIINLLKEKENPSHKAIQFIRGINEKEMSIPCSERKFKY